MRTLSDVIKFVYQGLKTIEYIFVNGLFLVKYAR